VGILAGFRVLSAVDLWGRHMLASDGGSAEVIHALVIAFVKTGARKGPRERAANRHICAAAWPQTKSGGLTLS